MNNQDKLQNVWAMADKPIIDIMTKKTGRPLAVPLTKDSSEQSSDSESEKNSYGSFVAIPKEFRPYLPPGVEEIKHFKKTSPNKNIQNTSDQHSNSDSMKFAGDTLSKNSFPKNDNSAFLEKKQFCTNYSSRTETQVSVKDYGILSKNIGNFKNCSQTATDTSSTQTTETNAHLQNDKITIKKKTPFQQVRNKAVNNSLTSHEQSRVLRPKESKSKRKNKLKYEYIEKQEHGTIQLNFEIPSRKDQNPLLKDGLKHEAKISRNTKQRQKYSRPCTGQDFNERPYNASFHENTVKWDHTLGLDDMNSDSLDSNSDNPDKIEWTVIGERKTIDLAMKTFNPAMKTFDPAMKTFDPAMKVKGNKNTHKHFGERPSRPRNYNQARQPARKHHYHQKKCSGSEPEENNLNQYSKLKTVPKQSKMGQKECDTEAPFYKSNLTLNSDNIKHIGTHVQKSDTEKEAMKVKENKNIHKHLGERPFRPRNYNQVRQPARKPHYNQKKCSGSEPEENNLNQYSELETVPKQSKLDQKECNTETPFYKSNLPLNNDNIKCTGTNIQKSDTEKESMNIDYESFSRQYTVSQTNFKTPNIYPISSNDSSVMHETNHNAERKFDKPMKYPPTNFESYNNQNRKLNITTEKSDYSKARDIEEKKNYMLQYGREMSDLIIGSHTALSMFISFYKEWKLSRQEIIDHFEQLEKNLKETSKKVLKYNDILNMAKAGASFASGIPHPKVSAAGRIVSVLTDLFSTFVKTSDKKKTDVETPNELCTSAFRDMHLSSELYMYALQCHQQFEETVKIIEKFHSNAGNPELFEEESREIATFIRGILEYKPKHHIFYKKLHKCFQELIQTCSSDFSKRFCEPFLLYPSTAVEVIGFLNWRFRYEDFSGESVRFELEQIQRLIEDGNSTSVKDLLNKIHSCLAVLRDELAFVEGCVKDVSLFDLEQAN